VGEASDHARDGESGDGLVTKPRFSYSRPWGRIEVQIGDPEFIHIGDHPIREWLFQRRLAETAADLEALDQIKDQLVRGSKRPRMGEVQWSTVQAEFSADELVIAGHQVMQSWERPLMEAMADIAAAGHGDVLEIGFGMGISASLLQQRGVSSHTIIELNADVFDRAREWSAEMPDADIRLVHGGWKDVVDALGSFDAVFYDTYPTSDDSFVLTRIPFPEEFFPVAARLLRPGGVFTYYSNEIDSLSRWHQRHLLQQFSRFSVGIVRGLEPPEDCYYWWAPTMATVAAYH
jgi:SAM-dependent methyltransferase